MKSGIAFFLASFFIFSTASAQTFSCADSDTLLDVDQSYQCESSENGAQVCINLGLHQALNDDALRIFSMGDDSYFLEVLFIHEPVLLDCAIPAASGCTNEWIRTSKKGIKAYKHRAPDTWDARSSKWNFDMNYSTTTATLVQKYFDVNGSLEKQEIRTFFNCQLIK